MTFPLTFEGADTTVLAGTYAAPKGRGSVTVTTVWVTALTLVTVIVYVMTSPASTNPPPLDAFVIRRGGGWGAMVTVDVSFALIGSGRSRAVIVIRFVIVQPAVLVFTSAYSHSVALPPAGNVPTVHTPDPLL